WIEEARGRRARASASVARWADAKRDLESMLAVIDPGDSERRAEVLEGLGEASFWLMDVPSVHQDAAVAAELAARGGRDDLAMAAHGWRGGGHGADGRLNMGIAEFDLAVQQARELAVAPPANVLTFHALTLYWLGRLDDAIERSRAGVEAARKANDPSVLMYSLPHLGLSLASRGRYTEALEVFAEARWFGREYGVSNLLARSIAMSTGFRLELGDFAGAEELSHEARDLALSGGWSPTAASASIDLLFNYVWRGDLGKAEGMLADVAGTVETAAGFHGWLWRLRLAEARAEIAAARGELEDAVRLASAAIVESRACKRRKYEAAGLNTRARALAALGRPSDAVVDLKRALRFARSTGDPLLFLRVSTALLALSDDAQLAEETRALAAAVRESLTEERLRRSFAESPLCDLTA